MNKIRKKGHARRSDLRANVINYVLKEGNTKRKAVSKYKKSKVSYASVKRWCSRAEVENSRLPKFPGRPPKIDKAKLQAAYNRYPPPSTLEELAREFNVTAAAIFYAKKRMKIRRKRALFHRNKAAWKKDNTS